MADSPAVGVFIGRSLLPPAQMLRVLSATDRLAGSWASSEELGLLGRGRTSQVRPADLAAQGPLDEIRAVLAPAVLAWARRCGFWFPRPPRLQLFPVRMIGDPAQPPRQEPHIDSYGAAEGPPICTSVFYVRASGLTGGALAAEPATGGDAPPVILTPAPNMVVTLPGDRVHWVEPLLAGERVSIVVNFY
jgi:hypothetical protein